MAQWNILGRKLLETSDGKQPYKLQLNNLGREIKKVNEKVYVAQVGCEQFVENMDPYVDEGIGERAVVGINHFAIVFVYGKIKWMDSFYPDEEESVTYQMVWSHPRFKCHTNEQCNKIPPLLKVNEEDKMNGFLNSYQSSIEVLQRSFLNLGPYFIEISQWRMALTRGFR
ncbi:hypothetical protein Tco_1243066 [Tanacetum coccineum]